MLEKCKPQQWARNRGLYAHAVTCDGFQALMDTATFKRSSSSKWRRSCAMDRATHDDLFAPARTMSALMIFSLSLQIGQVRFRPILSTTGEVGKWTIENRTVW